MRLIKIGAFLEREEVMRQKGKLDRRIKVLEFRDDETTKYAILSHRWIDPAEVDYEEIVDLAKMNRQERDEIRGRLGYKKILETCELAKKDGYEWVWVDTCCIDKRSSAELSEAINSMYRWYANSRVCYAYLHDVHGSFPAKHDDEKYPKSNGLPEWFSRGWTLQEMIAPSNVQFFNKDWQAIGDKKKLVQTLKILTKVPEHILTDGLSGNRPCVAQIMSWAAERTTTRVEDRAYSLMGLLDVNMPMLYGEGKKAFHRLQLEVIRMSNDQSIFVWAGFPINNARIGSILADDPSSFGWCSDMELMEHDEFIGCLKHDIPVKELSSIKQDHFGTFSITNRGIKIRMLLRPYPDSNTVFQAYLPCHVKSGAPVSIDLALWNSNYYLYPQEFFSHPQNPLPLQFCQVYLRYQDTCPDVTFKVDDSAVIEKGYSSKLTEDTLTLTGANPFCVRTYSNEQGNSRFAVVFGQFLGWDWVHWIDDPPSDPFRFEMLALKGIDRAQSMAYLPCRDGTHSRRMWVHHGRLPGSWIVRTYRAVWERSKIQVRVEVFHDPDFHNDLEEWKSFDIEVSAFLDLRMDYSHENS